MKDSIEHRLAALQPPKPSGQTQAIRDRYDAIEAALSRGVTRQQIVELLADEGISITPQFFKNVLQRIRWQRKQGIRQAASIPPAATPVAAAEVRALPAPAIDAWQRIDEIQRTTPDLQALRRQHLASTKGKPK